MPCSSVVTGSSGVLVVWGCFFVHFFFKVYLGLFLLFCLNISKHWSPSRFLVLIAIDIKENTTLWTLLAIPATTQLTAWRKLQSKNSYNPQSSLCYSNSKIRKKSNRQDKREREPKIKDFDAAGKGKCQIQVLNYPMKLPYEVWWSQSSSRKICLPIPWIRAHQKLQKRDLQVVISPWWQPALK